jgi:hypothetical protein
MAWTYSNDPDPTGTAAQQRDAVRFFSQDNDTTRQLVSDEEIAMLLATEANVYMAAAIVAETAAQRIGGGVSSKSVEDLSISYSTTREEFKALAAKLRARGSGHQVPYCGGISIADKAAAEADTDVPLVAVRRGQHDNPGGGANVDERRDWGI